MASIRNFGYYSPYTEFLYTNHPIDISISITKVYGILRFNGGYDGALEINFYFGDSYPPPLVVNWPAIPIPGYLSAVEYDLPGVLTSNTRYYLKAQFVDCLGAGETVTYEGYFNTEIIGPGKATNPTPADDEEDVIKGLTKLEWDAP